MADSHTAPAKAVESSAGLYPWYVVSVLMLAQTFSFIDRMIMGLLVGPVRAAFGISDTQYSLLAGMAFAVFYAVMGLPLARIADRSSRRVLISVGISVWSLMTALCGMAQGFWTLFLARVGVGVGEATLSPAAYSLITDYFPKRVLARAFSVFTLGVTLGSGLAYLIGGKVVEWVQQIGVQTLPVLGEVQGWQLTFLSVGLPGLLVAALMFFTVKEPERKGRVHAGEGTSAGVPIAEVMGFLRSRRRAVLTHVFGMSLYIMAVFSLNVWGPTYLIRVFGYGPGEAGLVMGLVLMVGATAGLMTGGFVADRWFAAGRRDAYSRLIIISALCLLPFSVSLGFVGTPLLGIVCLALAVFFSAFQGGIAGGVIQLLAPAEMRGQVVALYFLTANLLGMGLGPTVVAAITDYVFADDAAIGKSLALTAAILCPLAVAVMLSGLGAVRQAVEDAERWQ